MYFLLSSPIRFLESQSNKLFKSKTGLEVGFSDHSLSLLPGSLAVMQGANIIEKHITLNRNYVGPDHKASLLPNELFEYINYIRKAEKTIGDGIKKLKELKKYKTSHAKKFNCN